MQSTNDRDFRFDTLKGFLIFLVVVGHAIEKFKPVDSTLLPIIKSIIFSFHMPAFVFISGYFSKNTYHFISFSRNLTKMLLIPFCLAQLAMWLLTSRSLGELFTPRWTLWYLLSLFFWRMLVIPFSKLRLCIPVSVLLALLIGFTPADKFLSVSRTIAFFPFFLIGYKTTATQINTIRKVNKWIVVPVFMCGVAAAAAIKSFGIPTSAFEMSCSYPKLGIENVQGLLLRAGIILLGAVLTTCLMILVPEKKKCFLSDIGRYSVTIYLAHSFVITLFKKGFSFFSLSFSTEILSISFILVLSVIICLIFGNCWVNKHYRIIIDKVASVVLEQEDMVRTA